MSGSINLDLLFLIFGLLILGCTFSSKISTRFSMPCLMLFLFVGLGLQWMLDIPVMQGMLEGKSTVGQLPHNQLPWDFANAFGTVALAFILFGGGYDSSLKGIKQVLVPGTILSTLGVLLTALLLGGFSFIVFMKHREGTVGMFVAQCLLFGSIISSTDASAVFSILRSKKISLKGTLRPLLEYESGSNDPMATLLTLFFLDMFVKVGNGASVTSSFLLFIPSFVWKMAVGVALGVVLTRAAIWIFNRIRLDYDGLYHVLGMGVVLIVYSTASLMNANGFMAVYVAGIVMGNSEFVFHNSFGRYSDALAWLMQVILFTLLGFKANFHLLFDPRFALCGVIMGLFLMLVARPLATFVCLVRSGYSLRAKALVSWVGLRGGAPIMLATFPLICTDAQWGQYGNFSAAEIMFNMVFFMVLMSVALQSFTIMPLARLLHLDSPLKVVPTAPLAFDQVTYNERKKDGHQADADDYADNRTGEFTVGRNSELADRELRNLGLPAGVFVLMVRRNAKYIVPRGNTLIREGDTLTVLGTENRLHETEVLFRTADG